ncbi:hypothetical protein [Kitasatospora sp. NPDC096204]|uniref:hypothetical protein n=1 Tax=Kitasatospora sp. NPDC096204 TaxID=3364094 RepID=UPI003823BA0D
MNEVLAELWPGVHGNGHHNRSPIQMLRVWMRHQQGDELSDRQVRAAINFERRIRLGNEVLVYLPESEAGFRFDQRLPSDGDLVVRWPDDRPTPSVRAVEMLALPPEDEKPTA